MSVPGFKKFAMRIEIDSYEEGENFLRGLIVAKTNNSSELFEDLIDGVNAGLEGARKARLEADEAAKRAAGL
jgi:hypothetical protein